MIAGIIWTIIYQDIIIMSNYYTWDIICCKNWWFNYNFIFKICFNKL